MNQQDNQFDNITFIQYLNRLVLEEAEKAITEELPGDRGEGVVPVRANDDNTVPTPTAEQSKVSADRRAILKKRHRMWGIRNPVVWMLEKIVDTELKIEKNRPTPTSATEPALTEKDAALVKHYLARQDKE